MFQAVIVFGVATVVFGISQQLWLSIIALGVMGAADTVSVVVRSSLVQLATPDAMRGRVSAVNYLFINASNQLGAFESGATCRLLGTVPAVVLGERWHSGRGATVDETVSDPASSRRSRRRCDSVAEALPTADEALQG